MNRLQAHLCPVPPEPPLHTAPTCIIHQTPGLSILHMVMYMPQCSSLRPSLPLLLLLSPKVCSLYLLAALHISTLFLDSIDIALIYDTGLPLSALLHSMDIWPGLVPPFGCCAYGYADTVLLWRFLCK